MGSPQGSLEFSARDQDWAVLIGRMAQGDQSALSTLYDSTARLVYGLVLRIVNEAPSAEEVLLDVFSQVWRQAGQYDGKRGAPLAWIMTIARTRAIDRVRSTRQEQQRRDPLDTVQAVRSESADPEQESVISERRFIVRQALAELTPEQRQVIELAYYSGMSHSEIAATLGQPLGTVKTRTRLGMMRLREALAPVLGGSR